MTIALTSTEFGAMRISNEHRSRKHSNPNVNELKPRISNLPIQNDFPYRYVFPANHPFSAFAQYLSAHPTIASSKSHNYEIYATASTPQQYHSNPLPEYKYLFKPPPPHHYQQPAQQYSSPNPIPLSSMPYHPTPSPVILLLHAGQSGAGSIQTFVLIPADPNQPSNLQLGPGQAYTNPIPSLPFAANAAYSLPVRQNMLPIAPATLPSPVLTHTPQFLKPSPSHYQNQMAPQQMVQRPVNLYQLQPSKYYPQKKNSIESKSSSVDNEKSESHTVSVSVTTTTERSADKLNIGNRISRLNSTVE